MPEPNQVPEPIITAAPEINVQEIMAAIKKRIQDKKETGVLKQNEIDDIEAMELLPLPDFLEIPNVYSPHLYPETPQIPMPPFDHAEPKFEVEEGTGARGLIKKLLIKMRSIIFPLIRFMTRPIYNELKQITFDARNDIAYKTHVNQYNIHKNTVLITPTIQQSREYIKLLHNCMNNMIVELSKLKIDQELLKTKLKVLEDKVEFIENRERAIEKKIVE